jgi:hypothetical protein
MTEVSKEFVEAMHAWKEFVQITEVVLAELAGFIAQRPQGSSQGRSLAGIPTSAPACPTVVGGGAVEVADDDDVDRGFGGTALEYGSLPERTADPKR